MQQVQEVCIAGDRVTRHSILREKLEKEKLIRRSNRDPNASSLDRHDLTVLLTKIRKNHPSTVILKIKDHIHADINSVVFEAILEALKKNRVCKVNLFICSELLINILNTRQCAHTVLIYTEFIKSYWR